MYFSCELVTNFDFMYLREKTLSESEKTITV